ncbi:uncharacterized protein LOC117512025 [Thalassophryne amazonica]|uniref:uncharacterized protein LOC117512025 n=1 Tax=Thalassophryne amazonica TaxID=390379 RepID=UPI0014718F78|nr:uncharacterized protein LOC117512025 [Thalassophryne amazonica]
MVRWRVTAQVSVYRRLVSGVHVMSLMYTGTQVHASRLKCSDCIFCCGALWDVGLRPISGPSAYKNSLNRLKPRVVRSDGRGLAGLDARAETVAVTGGCACWGHHGSRPSCSSHASPSSNKSCNSYRGIQRHCQAKWEIQSLQHVLGLRWGLLPVGRAWKTFLVRQLGGNLTRCLNHLSWHLSLRRSSRRVPHMVELHTLSECKPRYPTEESHFCHLYLQLYSFITQTS